MRNVILCRDEAAACFPIKAVNDARSFFSTDTRQCWAVVQQRVDQSVFAVTCSRMNRHARRFADDDQIVIFEQSRQWNRFRSGLDFFRSWIRKFNLIACQYKLAGWDGCAVKTNEAGANQLLDARAREFRQCHDQVKIDAHPSMLFGHDEVERCGSFACRFQRATAILLLPSSSMLQSISMSIEGRFS